MVEPVRLLEERRFDPPRLVDVEHDGAWWPGTQRAWRLCDDHRGWMADVEYVVQHDWGLGKYVLSVAPDRVRLRDELMPAPPTADEPGRGLGSGAPGSA